MSWQSPIIEVRQAHLRAVTAEQAQQWHLVVQHYLYCLSQAKEADDARAIRYFAGKLAYAYRKMNMPHKAAYYRALA